MLRQPVRIIARAPATAAMLMGTMPNAAEITVPPRMIWAVRALLRCGISVADHSSSSKSRLVRRPRTLWRLPTISSTSPASRRISLICVRIMRLRLCTPRTMQSVSMRKPACSMLRPIIREPGATMVSASIRSRTGRCSSSLSGSLGPPSWWIRPWKISGSCLRASISVARVAAMMSVSPGRRTMSSKGGRNGRSPRWTMRTVMFLRDGNMPPVALLPTSGWP